MSSHAQASPALASTLPLAAARGALTAAVETVVDALAGDPEPAPPPSPTRARPHRRRSRPDRRRRPARRRSSSTTTSRRAARSTAAASSSARPRAAAGVGAEVHVDEPWEGYDAMTAREVLDRLVGADEATLAVVRLYETANRNRATVLRATES